MKGRKEAINHILKSVQDKESIILFGDSDLDGIASVVIFKEALELLKNPNPLIFWANREKYGYGLSRRVLELLAPKAPALLIALDCATTNVEGVNLAQQMGFRVIIIDHHPAIDKLPQAEFIINPKQEEGVFKELCAAGLAYKVVKALLFAAQKEFEPERFLELAMIATLFDQVAQEGENEQIIEQGLLSLAQTERIGLRALMEVADCQLFDKQEIQEKIIAPLAAAGFENQQSEAFLLLREKSLKKAKGMARALLEKSEAKRRKIQEIIEEIEEGDVFSQLIFKGSKAWPLFLMGSAASRLCQRYKKPVFAYHQGREESQGSVRVPKGMDSIELMRPCAKLLINYGGHPRASGFGLKNENLEKFEKCLLKSLEPET